MRRHAVLTLAALVIAGLGLPLAAQPPARPDGDFADLAGSLAPAVYKKLAAKRGAGPLRVAVFPTGDADGQFTLAMQESSRVLQGELIYQLINLSRGQFLVLDKAALAREFRTAGVDPAGVKWGDPRQTADLLRKLSVDAAVTGTIDAKRANAPADFDARSRPTNVALTLHFKDASFAQVAGQVTSEAVVPETSRPTGQFQVEILVRSGERFVPIPLVTSNKMGSEYQGVFFAAVPRGVKLGTPEAEYRIRITNRGWKAGLSPDDLKFMAQEQPLAQTEATEAKRLYAVAVSVDGVNSIYQDTGAGKVGPVVVHAKNARKWVMAAPGRQVVTDRSRPEGYRLATVNGPGGSVIEVAGFQKDQQTAEAFTFAAAGESVAEAAGITSDVGVIALDFFRQMLPEDERRNSIDAARPPGAGDVGTKPGRTLSSSTFRINLKLSEKPYPRLRIFYRAEDEVPIPVAERVAALAEAPARP